MTHPPGRDEELERLREANAALTAKLERYQRLFDLMPVALATPIEGDGVEVHGNRKMAALLGIPPGNAVVLTGPPSPDTPYRWYRNGVELLELPHQTACREDREVTADLELVRADGTRSDLAAMAVPLGGEHGKRPDTACVFLELTEQKKAERALEATLEAVRQANEELQQFAYAASHDLQEPLRNIASYAQLLERRVPEGGDLRDYTSFIVQAVERMNTLIRDLLAYSRASNPLRRVPIRLESVVQWSLLNLQKAVADANASITHHDLPEVNADEMQMVQLFQNLLSNALKYRGADTPRIEIYGEEIGDGVCISVTDNGIGIDPRFHQQIFGVFKRLHGREVPGTGIGLALCRKIVEAHGGRLWVESDGRSGSTFRFTLPG